MLVVAVQVGFEESKYWKPVFHFIVFIVSRDESRRLSSYGSAAWIQLVQPPPRPRALAVLRHAALERRLLSIAPQVVTSLGAAAHVDENLEKAKL